MHQQGAEGLSKLAVMRSLNASSPARSTTICGLISCPDLGVPAQWGPDLMRFGSWRFLFGVTGVYMVGARTGDGPFSPSCTTRQKG